MRFKTLNIRNIASLKEASINFDKAPLCNEKLFLICGETGSGKTMILDSICLALYKESPRVTNKKNDAKYYDENLNQKENISVYDVRQYLKRGEKEGFAELAFEGNDGHNYTARLSISKSERASKASVNWQLCNETTKEVYSKDTEIKNKIQQVIGLSFEQFCRTVMLPQGDFKLFLESDKKAKADILEKLTGTEIYSTIGKKIFEKTNEKKKNLDSANAKLDGIQLLTNEETASIEHEITNLQKNIHQQEELKKEIDSKIKWLTDKTKLENDVANAAAKYKNVETRKNANAEVETILQQWQNTASARMAVLTINELDNEMLKIKNTETDLLAIFKYLENNEKQRKQNLTQKKTANEQLKTKLKEQEQYKDMFKDNQLIINCLERYSAAIAEIKKQTDKADECVKDKERLANQHDIIEKNRNKLEVEKANCDKNIADKLDKLTDNKFVGIDEAKDKIQTKLQSLNGLMAKQSQCEQSETALAMDKKTIDNYKLDIEKLNEKLNTLQQQYLEAKKQFEETEIVFEKTRLSVSETIADLKKKLQKGDTCPICGRTITDECNNEKPINTALEPLETDLKNKKVLYENLKDEKNKIEARIDEKKKLSDKLTKEYNNKNEEYNRTKIDFNNQCAKLNVTKDIKKAFNEADNELKKLNELIEQRNELRNQIDSLREDSNSKQGEIQTLKDKDIMLNEEIAKIETNRKVFCNSAEQQKQVAQTALTDIGNKIMYKDWKNNVADTITKLENEAEKYETDSNKAEQNDKEIEELNNELQKARDWYLKITAYYPEWQHISEYKQTNETNPTWENLFMKCTALTEKCKNNIETKNKNNNIVSQYLDNQKDITREHLVRLANMTDKRIADLRLLTDNLNKEMQEAGGAYEHTKKTLETHITEKPSMTADENYATLTEQSAKLKADIDEKNKLQGAAKQKLNENTINKTRFADAQEAVVKSRTEYDKWAAINKVFGDSDGNKFREIAQEYVLKQLLVYANEQLRRFSDRYELVSQGSLVILVKDLYNGGAPRTINLVSGGEGFILSLSLALGLSSLNNKNVSTDLLFIDEGFGTLSADYLEAVMSALNSLSMSRRVAMISHVESIRERIPMKLLVKRIDGTTSQVTLAQA